MGRNTDSMNTLSGMVNLLLEPVIKFHMRVQFISELEEFIRTDRRVTKCSQGQHIIISQPVLSRHPCYGTGPMLPVHFFD